MEFQERDFVEVLRNGIWVKARIEFVVEDHASHPSKRNYFVWGFELPDHRNFFSNAQFFPEQVRACPDCPNSARTSGVCADHEKMIQ